LSVKRQYDALVIAHQHPATDGLEWR
jgi:hypothetical protein